MYLVAGGRGLAGCGHLSVSLLGLLLLLARSGTRALVCLPCDESKCEEPRSCPGSIVQGVCGCCYMCARQRNESCGGAYGLHGACDRGLRCVIRPPLNGDSITEYEVGVCEDEDWDDDQLIGFEPCNENLISGCNIINGKCECGTIRTCNNPFEFPRKDMCLSALKRIEEEKPDCSKARCEVRFSPRCPEDSILIEGYAPPGECCPLPSRCVCDPAGCLRKVCQPGYLNILVSKASGKPGECCDLYECKPVFSVDCSTVECPPVQQAVCPLDSYETQVRLTADGCCTLPARCECLSGLCGFPVCEVGSTPRIVSRGDGTPGFICSRYLQRGDRYTETQTQTEAVPHPTPAGEWQLDAKLELTQEVSLSSDYRDHTKGWNQTYEQEATIQGTRSATPKMNIYHGGEGQSGGLEDWEVSISGRNRSAMQWGVIQGMGQSPSWYSRPNINKERSAFLVFPAEEGCHLSGVLTIMSQAEKSNWLDKSAGLLGSQYQVPATFEMEKPQRTHCFSEHISTVQLYNNYK